MLAEVVKWLQFGVSMSLLKSPGLFLVSLQTSEWLESRQSQFLLKFPLLLLLFTY